MSKPPTGMTCVGVKQLLSPYVSESVIDALLAMYNDDTLRSLLRNTTTAHIASAIGTKILKLAASEYAFRSDSASDTYRLTALTAKLVNGQQWENFLLVSGAVNTDEWSALMHLLSQRMGLETFCNAVLLPRFAELASESAPLDIPELINRLLPGVACGKLSTTQRLEALCKALESRGTVIQRTVELLEPSQQTLVKVKVVTADGHTIRCEIETVQHEEQSTLFDDVVLSEARRMVSSRPKKTLLSTSNGEGLPPSSLSSIGALKPASSRRSWAQLTAAEKHVVAAWIQRRMKLLLRLKDPYREELKEDGTLDRVVSSDGWIPLSDVGRLLKVDFEKCSSFTGLQFPDPELIADLIEEHDLYVRFQTGICNVDASPFNGVRCCRALTAHDAGTDVMRRILKSFNRIDLQQHNSTASSLFNEDGLSCSPNELLEQLQLPKTLWMAIDRKTVGDLNTHGLRVFDNVGFLTGFPFAVLERFSHYMRSPSAERYDEKLGKGTVRFAEIRLNALISDVSTTQSFAAEQGASPATLRANFELFYLPMKEGGGAAPPQHGPIGIVPEGLYARVIKDSADVVHVSRCLPTLYLTGRVCTIHDSTAPEPITIDVVAIPTRDPNIKGALLEHVKSVLAKCNECRSASSEASSSSLPLPDNDTATLMEALNRSKLPLVKLDSAPFLAQINEFAHSSHAHALTLRLPKMDSSGAPFQGRSAVVSDIKQHILSLGLKYRSLGTKAIDHEEYLVTKIYPFDQAYFKAAIESYFHDVFTSIELVREACTPEHVHISANYERLEFIGDAVLDYITVHDTGAVRGWERAGGLPARGYPYHTDTLTDAAAVLATQNAAHDLCRNSVLAWLLPAQLLLHVVLDYDGFVEKKCADHVEAIIGAMYEDGWSLDRIRAAIATAFSKRLTLLNRLLRCELGLSRRASPTPADADVAHESETTKNGSVSIASYIGDMQQLMSVDPSTAETTLLIRLLGRFATPARVDALLTAYETSPYTAEGALTMLQAEAPFNSGRLIAKVLRVTPRDKFSSKSKTKIYPVTQGYGPFAGSLTINSHAACRGFNRIQDKLFATHFTTGIQYSYRIVRRPHDMFAAEATMLRRQLVAALGPDYSRLVAAPGDDENERSMRQSRYVDFTRSTSLFPTAQTSNNNNNDNYGAQIVEDWTAAYRVPESIPFVNETFTDPTRLVFDVDGVRLTFCGLHKIIADWASRRFPWLHASGRAWVFDCSGVSIVKSKWKHSYHIHFPMIHVTLQELEFETRSLLEFVTQRVAWQSVALDGTGVYRGTIVIARPATAADDEQHSHSSDAAVDTVGRVVFSTKQLRCEAQRLKRDPRAIANCTVFDKLSGGGPVNVLLHVLVFLHLPEAFVLLRGVSMSVRLRLNEALLSAIDDPTQDYALVRCLQQQKQFRLFGLWNSTEAFAKFPIARCRPLLAPQQVTGIVTRIAKDGKKTRVTNSALQSLCNDYFANVVQPLLEADVYSYFYWAKAIDCNVAQSRKLRHYGSDKFDQKYGLESRPLRFAGFISLAHGGLFDNGDRRELVRIDTLIEVSSLRSPEYVGPDGRVYLSWNAARCERFDLAHDWLVRCGPSEQPKSHGEATPLLAAAARVQAFTPEQLVEVYADTILTTASAVPGGSIEDGLGLGAALGAPRNTFPLLHELGDPLHSAATWDTLVPNLFVVRPPAESASEKSEGVTRRYGALIPWEIWFDATRSEAVVEPTGIRFSGRDIREALASVQLGGGGGMDSLVRRLLPHLSPPGPFRREDVPAHVTNRWILSVDGAKAHAAALSRRPLPIALVRSRGSNPPPAAAAAAPRSPSLPLSLRTSRRCSPTECEVQPIPSSPNAVDPPSTTAVGPPSPTAVGPLPHSIPDLAQALKYLKWKCVPNNLSRISLRTAFVSFINSAVWPVGVSDAAEVAPVPREVLLAIWRTVLLVSHPLSHGIWACREPRTFETLRALGVTNSFTYHSFPRRSLSGEVPLYGVLVLLELTRVDPCVMIKSLSNLREGGCIIVQSQPQARALARILGLQLLC